MAALPRIIMEVFSPKEKKELLEDLGITIFIILLLITLKYGF